MVESQKEFLYLIHDFSNQKTHGERRVSDLKKHMIDLTSSVDSSNSDLQNAKRSRETAEHELKGAQVHLAMTDASILALESRMSNLQDEISRVGSELNSFKNEEDSNRDDFIKMMLEMNKKIREFQAQNISDQQLCVLSPNKEMVESENITKALEDKIKCVNNKIHMLEIEYEKEMNNHNQVNGELENMRKKIALMEAILEESKYMHDLAEYPFQKY